MQIGVFTPFRKKIVLTKPHDYPICASTTDPFAWQFFQEPS
jgi:hypothetical protein